MSHIMGKSINWVSHKELDRGSKFGWYFKKLLFFIIRNLHTKKNFIKSTSLKCSKSVVPINYVFMEN